MITYFQAPYEVQQKSRKVAVNDGIVNDGIVNGKIVNEGIMNDGIVTNVTGVK